MEKTDVLLDTQWLKAHYGGFNKPGLSVFLVLHNCIWYGHPFVESILTILPIADELVLLDVESFDGTEDVIERLRQKFPDKIRTHRIPLIPTGYGKPAWGIWHRIALDLCRYNFVLLLQADEIYSQGLINEILEWKKNLKLATTITINGREYRTADMHFRHVSRTFKDYLKSPAYYSATRISQNGLNTSIEGDGWRFLNFTLPKLNTYAFKQENPIWHITSECFSINHLRRTIIRAHFYQYGVWVPSRDELLKAPKEPQRLKGQPIFVEGLPEIVRPLVGWDRYFVREELLN